MKTKRELSDVASQSSILHPISMLPSHSIQIDEAVVGYSRRATVSDSNVPQAASIPIMAVDMQPPVRHYSIVQGPTASFVSGKHPVPMYSAHDIVRNAITFTKSKLTAAVLRPPSNFKRSRSNLDLDDSTTVASDDSKRQRKGSEDTNLSAPQPRSMSIDSDYNRDTDSVVSGTKETSYLGQLNSLNSATCIEDRGTTSSENSVCSNVISQSTIAPPSPAVVSLFDLKIPPIVRSWGERMRQVHPVDYLQHLLTSRGYDNSYLESVTYRTARHGTLLTEKQVQDYNCDIVSAVRTSDLATLRRLQREGKSMAACNRFSESIVHMACRRSDLDTIQFILDHIDTVLLVDDYGRTPLHDACWRPEPKFDIVALLMDTNLDLIRCVDKRGSTPLHYVRREHWAQWCAFLEVQKEKYWAPIHRSSADKVPSTTLLSKQSATQLNGTNNTAAAGFGAAMLPPRPINTPSASAPHTAREQESLIYPHIHSRITTSINEASTHTQATSV